MASLQDRWAQQAPAQLYVHAPFCVDRCVYCAFATIAEDPALHRPWLDAVLAEAREVGVAPASPSPSAQVGPRTPPSNGGGEPLPGGASPHPKGPQDGSKRTPSDTKEAAIEVAPTLYIGGGTPGLLSSGTLKGLIGALIGTTNPSAPAETTLEANPANVTPDAMTSWSSCGISRLSLGVQSFDDGALVAMARRHTAKEAHRALALVAERWPGTWSCDLLVGWEGSTPEQVERDVAALLEYDPPHVSIYGLTVEEGTPLERWVARGRGPLAPAEVLPELDARWAHMLEDAGLERYEVSNFARPDHRSLHNQAYWANRPYLGFGPGASSSTGEHRWSNERDTLRYLARVADGRSPRVRAERLSPTDRLLETLGAGLRASDGIPVARLDDRFGPAWREPVLAAGARLLDDGLLLLDDERLATAPGALVRVDRILTELVQAWPLP